MTTTSETAARTWDELAEQVEDWLCHVPKDRRILHPPLSDQVSAMGVRAGRFRLAAANCRVEAGRLCCDDCCTSLVPGAVIVGRLAAVDAVTACPSCSRFFGDLDAAQALATIVGGQVWYYPDSDSVQPDTHRPVRWPGHYTDDQPPIADGTDPWVEVDDEAARWLVTP